jgi:catechol 2,3-dioxygenase-like lactoylglutathione lyase family enzyme
MEAPPSSNRLRTMPRLSIRLRYATVRTTDLARSLRFYEDVLGLERTKTRAGEYVELDVGGAELCVDVDTSGGSQPSLIFAVDDVAALSRRLAEAGIAIAAGGPDAGYVVVEDPDGHQLAFEATMRSGP